MSHKTTKRNIFQRMLGKPITELATDADCWQVDGAVIEVDLDRVPELAGAYGAVRLEGAALAGDVLILKDARGDYHAFENKCAHGGRKLDPVPGTETVCCCSLGKSVFDYEGNVLSGSAKYPIRVFPVSLAGGRLTVYVN